LQNNDTYFSEPPQRKLGVITKSLILFSLLLKII
jgi:hypothetical protein